MTLILQPDLRIQEGFKLVLHRLEKLFGEDEPIPARGA
jgi:hypothetical protein